MLINGVLFLVGLAGLYYGAEWLVKGSARMARRHGVSPLVVGLTIVAFGSSAPELVVGIVASVQEQSAVVVGNVVGSNILNIALILGITALVRPLRTELRLLAREAPLMVVATVVVVLMMLDEALGRADGILLAAGFVGYLIFVLKAARKEPRKVLREYEMAEPTGLEESTDRRDALFIVLGLVGLAVGAQVLLTSAVYFARLFGISEAVIGITVVAIGTSLPELATSAVAAVRSEADIAMGNVVGSNIFNLLSILSVSALIRPIPVDPVLMQFEIPAMLFFAILLIALAWHRRILGRWSGGLLLAGYALFTTVLIMRTMA